LQNAIKLLIPLLHLRARLQHRAGLRKNEKSAMADGIVKLVPVIGDSRMLFRIWGKFKQPYILFLPRIRRDNVIYKKDLCRY
jgi:hypothetical protein